MGFSKSSASQSILFSVFYANRHVAHAESEQEAREALSNLIKNVTASKLQSK